MNSKLIREVIEKHAATATGNLGVYFKDLVTGEEIGHFENEIYPSASVFKVFVLAEMFRQINEGKYGLHDRFPLKDEDKSPGSGVMQLMESGMEPTIKDYATLMMILSDNTSADFLFKLTGRENIIANVLEPLELKATKCDLTCKDLIAVCFQDKPGEDNLSDNRCLRNTDAFTGKLELNDETSPRDVAKVLELMYTGKWVNAEASEQALDIMKLCQTNGRIPKFLPKGTPVAHKTGTMDRVANDAGIVYTPKGDYILTLFYNGNTASEEEYSKNTHNFFSEGLLAHISEDVYNAYVE